MQTLQSDGPSYGTLSVIGLKWLEVVHITVMFSRFCKGLVDDLEESTG